MDFDLRAWAHVSVGLAVGAFAHFSRKLSRGEPLSARAILAYLLQLGFIGLVAVIGSKIGGVTDPDYRAGIAALLALAANEMVDIARRRAVHFAANVGADRPGGPAALSPTEIDALLARHGGTPASPPVPAPESPDAQG